MTVTQKSLSLRAVRPTNRYRTADPHQRSSSYGAALNSSFVPGMGKRPFLSPPPAPISERRYENGPGLYGTICLHHSIKDETTYAWSEELAIKSAKKRYQWSFGAYGFYNSLNTDGPVIFQARRADRYLQKHSTTSGPSIPQAPKN